MKITGYQSLPKLNYPLNSAGLTLFPQQGKSFINAYEMFVIHNFLHITAIIIYFDVKGSDGVKHDCYILLLDKLNLVLINLLFLLKNRSL